MAEGQMRQGGDELLGHYHGSGQRAVPDGACLAARKDCGPGFVEAWAGV